MYMYVHVYKHTSNLGKAIITRYTMYMYIVYREKSIPMTALWCPAFSNHG